jgi:5,10-methylenetetrahydromethanopterin reductase
MRLAINGSGTLARPSLDRIVAHARQAADDGFAGYWLAQTGAVDALVALSLVAQEVPAIELGTAVIPTWFRHPFALGAQAITTQAAVGGRLRLGIGLSHKPVTEDRFDIPFAKPVRHMREYLAVLNSLLTQGKVSAHGEIWSGELEVAPLEGVDPPPVLVAALGPQMLRLAGREADGTILWMVGPKTIASHIAPTIREAADRAGRPAPRIVASLPVCVTDDAEGTRQRAAAVFAGYGLLPSYRAMLDREGALGPEDAAVIGDEGAVTDHLEAIAAGGATDFAAVEFVRGDEERDRTRALLKSLASRWG